MVRKTEKTKKKIFFELSMKLYKFTHRKIAIIIANIFKHTWSIQSSLNNSVLFCFSSTHSLYELLLLLVGQLHTKILNISKLMVT